MNEALDMAVHFLDVSLPNMQRKWSLHVKPWFHVKIKQEGQHPLTGQRVANFRLLANQ